ncbi:MAG TPA: hypothetical protein VGK63_12220 [Candidatus Limnocylindrales bacterium]
MTETSKRTTADRVVECDACGRRLRLRGAGLVEDGGVLCRECAPVDVACDLDLPTAA